MDDRVPVMLLHGFGAGRKVWGKEFLSGLRQEWVDPVVVSMPGHDGTPVAGHTSFIAGLIENPMWLCGWSMGGYTALQVALAYPDLVEGVVLLSAGAGGGSGGKATIAFRDRAIEYARILEEEGTEKFARFYFTQPRFNGLDEEQIERLVEISGQSNAHDLAETALTELVDRTPVDMLSGYWDGPGLIVYGSEDPASAVTNSLVNLLPEASTVMFDAGHAIHLEDPILLAEVIGEKVHM